MAPLTRFGGRRRIREELDEELRFHLEMRARELERQGMSPSAARDEALRRFGDLETTRRTCLRSDLRKERRTRRLEFVADLVQDSKLALRQLWRRPLFTITAVVTLAVGIGASTAVFSAAHHVLFRPLPYDDVERVMTLWETRRETGDERLEVSTGNFLDWRQRCRAFEAIALAEPSGFDLTGLDPPVSARAWLVTEGFLEALGVQPLLGRDFLASEHRDSAQRVVLMSHRLWRSRFGADPAIVGSSIEVDGEATLVAGVLPPGLDYPERTDLFAPKAFAPWEVDERASGYMQAVGRLAPGIGPAGAQADLDRVAAELAREHPATNAGAGASVLPLREHVLGPVRPALLVLLGTVGLVLLIACANVAHLLLVRMVERDRELAVRAALGARRTRLVRQILAESLVLAAAGGGAGILLAQPALGLLVALAPPELPRLDAVSVDGPVLAFAALVSVATALAFGAAPAIQLSGHGALRALRGGPGRVTSDPRHQRFRASLVAAELAVAMILLVGAGLLGRSFAALLENDLGFQADGRVALQLFFWDRAPTFEGRVQQASQVLDTLRATPGVAAVGAVSSLPLHPDAIDAADAFSIEGHPAGEGQPRTWTTIATPGYFDVLGIPLKRGRDFDHADHADAPRVAVVNETFVRRFFRGEDPIGHVVEVGVMAPPQRWQIVGVVGDVRPVSLDSPQRPELFVPHAQHGTGGLTFVARTDGDPAVLLQTLQQRIWELLPSQTIYSAASMEDLVSRTLVERRFHLILLAVFSSIAVVLSCVGIYGVIGFITAQRSGEIGVRLALGAGTGRVIAMIVGQALRLSLPGLVAGLLGGVLLARALAHLPYPIASPDAATFVQVGLLMLLTVVLAAYVPARRAVAGDPVRSLRSD